MHFSSKLTFTQGSVVSHRSRSLRLVRQTSERSETHAHTPLRPPSFCDNFFATAENHSQVRNHVTLSHTTTHPRASLENERKKACFRKRRDTYQARRARPGSSRRMKNQFCSAKISTPGTVTRPLHMWIPCLLRAMPSKNILKLQNVVM